MAARPLKQTYPAEAVGSFAVPGLLAVEAPAGLAAQFLQAVRASISCSVTGPGSSSSSICFPRLFSGRGNDEVGDRGCAVLAAVGQQGEHLDGPVLNHRGLVFHWHRG